MIEHILRINPERQTFRLRDSDALLHVRVEVPTARPLDWTQPQRAQLSGRGIPQHDIPVGVRKRGQCAKGSKRCGDTGARRIGDSLILLRKEIAECIALFQWPDDLSFSRKRSGNIRCARGVDGISAHNIQWSSGSEVDDRTEVPVLDESR